jgi:putative sigma-54 modulation protein
MHIDITGRHLEITGALKDYVEQKFEKIARHSTLLSRAEVILILEKNVQRAEATLVMDGDDLFAHHEASDMYAAIDGLVDKLDRQAIKQKEKLKKHG